MSSGQWHKRLEDLLMGPMPRKAQVQVLSDLRLYPRGLSMSEGDAANDWQPATRQHAAGSRVRRIGTHKPVSWHPIAGVSTKRTATRLRDWSAWDVWDMQQPGGRLLQCGRALQSQVGTPRPQSISRAWPVHLSRQRLDKGPQEPSPTDPRWGATSQSAPTTQGPPSQSS